MKNEKIMIQANELRIGNLVEYQSTLGNYVNNIPKWAELKILWVDIFGVEEFPEQYKPIPLTEERLLEFGFKDNSIMIDTIDKTLNISAIVGKDFYLYLDDVFGSAYDLNCIQSVHQLQNLYHALTGQELILNQELPSTFLP